MLFGVAVLIPLISATPAGPVMYGKVGRERVP
jgi:hypothetical protein